MTYTEMNHFINLESRLSAFALPNQQSSNEFACKFDYQRSKIEHGTSISVQN